MNLESVHAGWQTLEGEKIKHMAEFSLHSLSKNALGFMALQLAQGGRRIEDPRLRTSVGGLELENPLLVGAGWDKKGWAVDGLYLLGFAGTEVGSVLVYPQGGNSKPGLFYRQGAGLNRLGFNSEGQEAVAGYLDDQQRFGITGISIGKNKTLPDKDAPWAHAAVAERLYEYGDYFVINLASPNTPGLRDLLKPRPLTDIGQAVQETLKAKGEKPLFIKTTVDLALEDLDKVIEVCLVIGATGLIDSNTTIDERLKARYGWRGQAGGLSGDVPVFRRRATERMRYLTRVTRGTGLQRIGVGGINNAESAIERLEAGAQALQVVTGIRQRKSRIAHTINSGILKYMERNGISSVAEFSQIA